MFENGRYCVVLINLKTNKLLVLSDHKMRAQALTYRLNWRKVLGGKNWTVERRDGLDTLDHLGLRVMSEREIENYGA